MNFRLNPVFIAVLAAYGLTLPSIAAASIDDSLTVSNQSVTGSYSISGTSSTQTGTSVSANSTDYGLTSSGLSYYPYASFGGNTGTGDLSAYARAGGLTTPWYGSDTGVLVPFTDAASSISYHATFTNGSQIARSYNFNFLLAGGVLNTLQWTPGTASIFGSILVNGSLAWSTQAQLDQNGGFSFTGADLGFNENSTLWAQHEYQFGPYQSSVNLGLLNPGQSVTIDYTLQSSATTYGFDYYGGSIASISDPVGVEGFSVAQVTAVPEPESYSMMAAGLGLLAARLRRRNKVIIRSE